MDDHSAKMKLADIGNKNILKISEKKNWETTTYNPQREITVVSEKHVTSILGTNNKPSKKIAWSKEQGLLAL
jgi:hypothetical protein